MDTLAREVMNLSSGGSNDAGYLAGHRDARHAAAELIDAYAIQSEEKGQDFLDLDNLLVTRHLNPRQPGETLRQAVDRVISWDVSVALDPLVSSDAQALIDQGKAFQPTAEDGVREAAQNALDFLIELGKGRWEDRPRVVLDLEAALQRLLPPTEPTDSLSNLPKL